MKRTLSLLLAGLLLLPLAGCGKAPAPTESSGYTIVTSFYPMYLATINIARDIPGVTVVNMTQPQTGCLHDYQLTPEDMKKLEAADVFVANGAGMESFLQDVLTQQKGLTVVNASQGIALLNDPSGDPNPHLWVSIGHAIQQVGNIAEGLAAADPDHAARYQSNAAAYGAKLAGLQAEMHAALDPLPHRDIVTFHEAFPYFAEEFNLNIVSVVEREPGSEPSATELAETIDAVNASGVKALFAEPQYPAKTAEVIARETGARVYTLDPVVTGDATPDAMDAYLIAMRKNMEVLKEALQ